MIHLFRTFLMPPLVLLVLTATCQAQTIKLPEEVRGSPGMILVPAVTDCETVLWVVPKGSALQIVPPDLLKNTKTAICICTVPGTYHIQAIVAKDSTPAWAMTKVIVEGTPPGPGPGPGPDPLPPDDPLTAAFQKAYNSDPDPQKAVRLPILIDCMNQASDSSMDPSVKTLVHLNKAVHALTEKLVGEKANGALAKTRDAVGIHLNANLPTSTVPDMPITEADRNKCRTHYAKVAAALKGVKP